MKNCLLFIPILFCLSFKPLPVKPMLEVSSVYIGNNFNADNSGSVELHISIDAPVSSTVQVVVVLKQWTYALNIPFKFGQPMYSWKWTYPTYNVFIPAGSTDGWAYGLLGVGEYVSTTEYTIYGPYVL